MYKMSQSWLLSPQSISNVLQEYTHICLLIDFLSQVSSLYIITAGSWAESTRLVSACSPPTTTLRICGTPAARLVDFNSCKTVSKKGLSYTLRNNIKSTSVNGSLYFLHLIHPNFFSSSLTVALNFQTQGEQMDLNQGRFLPNARCGYVLKPSFLCEPDSEFNPENTGGGPGHNPILLVIKVGYPFLNFLTYTERYISSSLLISPLCYSLMWIILTGAIWQNYVLTLKWYLRLLVPGSRN